MVKWNLDEGSGFQISFLELRMRHGTDCNRDLK